MSTLILFVSHLYTSDEAVSHNICLFTLNSTWMPVGWVGCCRWLRCASYNRFHAPFPAKRWTAPAKIDIVPLNHRVRCSHHRFCICIRVAFAQGITTVDNHTYTLHTHTHTHTHTHIHTSAPWIISHRIADVSMLIYGLSSYHVFSVDERLDSGSIQAKISVFFVARY